MINQPNKKEILRIENLYVSIPDNQNNNQDTTIIQDFSLKIHQNEIHALMGPNGSGKSTLTNAIMGHPSYKIESGRIFFKEEDITELPTHERARKGLFVSFQHPVAVPGVTLTNFMRTSVNAVHGETQVRDFRLAYKKNLEDLKIDPSFTSRYINDGFSGGEKKRIEILQLAMLKPALSILDEIDSGLDVDALNVVSQGIKQLSPPDMSLLLITHYQRLLDLIQPEYVHIFANGKIIKSGDFELAKKIEKEGYDWIAPQMVLKS